MPIQFHLQKWMQVPIGLSWGILLRPGDFWPLRKSQAWKLFLGSYPITPASDILHELVKAQAFWGQKPCRPKMKLQE